ncbi:Holo-ACP synthase [[Mycoplasma] cavipharyngis]|uniref:4'-phosphopantetheinyl transferase superfamily protein n=1 Tax=[Mycoplasma] cavipharyngis TaxID=92757 RepID=UPI0037042033
MKIIGFGVDLEPLARFDHRISKINKFLIKRFLSPKEYQTFKKINNHQGQVRFLTSHWCAKEAVFKALKRNDIALDKIELIRLENGHLSFRPNNLPVEGLLSLTYSEGHCAAACVLIERDLTIRPLDIDTNDEALRLQISNWNKTTDTYGFKPNLATKSLEKTNHELTSEMVQQLSEKTQALINNFDPKANNQNLIHSLEDIKKSLSKMQDQLEDPNKNNYNLNQVAHSLGEIENKLTNKIDQLIDRLNYVMKIN